MSLIDALVSLIDALMSLIYCYKPQNGQELSGIFGIIGFNYLTEIIGAN